MTTPNPVRGTVSAEGGVTERIAEIVEGWRHSVRDCNDEVGDVVREFADSIEAALSAQPASAHDRSRFFVEHGMLHDRETGKHITTLPPTETLPDGEELDNSAHGLTIHETCELLNFLDSKPFGKSVTEQADWRAAMVYLLDRIGGDAATFVGNGANPTPQELQDEIYSMVCHLEERAKHSAQAGSAEPVEIPAWLDEFMKKYRLAPHDWDTLAEWFRAAHEERIQLRDRVDFLERKHTAPTPVAAYREVTLDDAFNIKRDADGIPCLESEAEDLLTSLRSYGAVIRTAQRALPGEGKG